MGLLLSLLAMALTAAAQTAAAPPSPQPSKADADANGSVHLLNASSGSTHIPAGCYQARKDGCTPISGVYPALRKHKHGCGATGCVQLVLQIRYLGGCIPCPWSWSNLASPGWCLGWGWHLVDEAGNRLRQSEAARACQMCYGLYQVALLLLHQPCAQACGKNSLRLKYSQFAPHSL